MRTSCYQHMSAEERETLSLGLARGHSLRAMAAVLRRAPSTLSRECARNTIRGSPYRACPAQTQAATRARQPRRRCKLLDPWLWQYVRTRLAAGCSPEQIGGRLRRAYPDDMGKHLSAETIYAALYVLPRGTLRSELLATLRQTRKARRPRLRGQDRRGQLPNITPIADRPTDVASRTVPGHWESDLLRGARNGFGRWHPGGTDDSLGPAGQNGRHGCRECVPGIHEEARACARPAAENTDLRSGQRDGGTRAVSAPSLAPGVLCRSAQPLATRDQREYQWPAAPVLAEGHR